MSNLAPWSQTWVLEDDAATHSRRRMKAIGGAVAERVRMRLHKVTADTTEVLAERAYVAGSMKGSRGAKAALAYGLIAQRVRSDRAVVVCGASYGSNGEFLTLLAENKVPFVVELQASVFARRADARHGLAQALAGAKWETFEVAQPATGNVVKFKAAELPALSHPRISGRVFVAQTGGIDGFHRGTLIGFSRFDTSVEHLVRALVWARWVRLHVRREKREPPQVARARSVIATSEAKLKVRANIAQASRQDDRLHELDSSSPTLRGKLGGHHRPLRVVELFAGAGGMGLGFLLANAGRGYRVIFSGEVNPTYAATLQLNHTLLAKQQDGATRIPAETIAVDLRAYSA